MKAILDQIKMAKSIVIYTHLNPDGDCNGSAFGLRHLIWDNVDKSRDIKVVGKDCPAYLSFLGDYDKVSDNMAERSLSIVVDTAVAHRVSDQRFATSAYVIKIDHHLDSPDYGTINLVEHLPSCAELVVKLAEEFKWKISKEAALPLLTGIITDTGRFRFARNHAPSFMTAGKLLATGLDLQNDIYQYLYARNPQGLAFQAWYLKNIRFVNKCAYVVVSQAVIDRFKLEVGSASEWLSNLRDFSGVTLWAQFVKYPGCWRCEYRSTGYPVNELARKYGGGGHRQASGSQAKTLKDVKRIIREMEEINE